MDEKLREAVAGVMKDESQRQALAEMIVEWIQPNHIAVDFISMLLNSRSLNPGDMLVKRVRKGINVHTLVPGQMTLKHEITIADRMNYMLDYAVTSVTANAWELKNGDIGTVESMKSEMMAKLRDYYMNKVFTTLTNVWNGSNTPYNWISAGGHITETILKTGIDYLSQTVGGVKAIVGTRALLNPITAFGAFWTDGTNTTYVPDNVREIMATGWLGKFYGVPVIALQQEYDFPDDHNALLPTDKVLLVGENVGEFITYGPPTSNEWTEPRVIPNQWNLDIYQAFGLIVDNAQGLYVISNVT
jgi:hypothetical protein